MKLIIDIHEKDYQSMKNGHIPFSVLDAIMKGKPLPKGHGRLIDADFLFDRVQFADLSSSDDINTVLMTICDTPTIIEADKGE